MTAPLSPARLLLLRAADYMETHGHCKQTLRDDAGRVCLRGALIATSGQQELRWSDVKDDPVIREADNMVREYVRPFLGARFHWDWEGFHVQWNNLPRTTQKDVVAALRGAAMAGL